MAAAITDVERETPAKIAAFCIGSLISVTSNSEIRYGGFLFYLSPYGSTIGFRNGIPLALIFLTLLILGHI